MSKSVAGYGIIGAEAIVVFEQFLGPASSTLLVAVNESIFGKFPRFPF